MLKTAPDRRGGRPDQQSLEALERRLIETAARLFIEQGCDATSIDQVAAAAGVGKQTIYRRYPTKEHLVRAVIGQHMVGKVVEAWGRRMEALADEIAGQIDSPLAALKQICRIILDFILDPDAVRLYRMIIAEERRSPLTILEIESGALVFEQVLNRRLKAAEQSGEIAPGQSELAAEVLVSSLTGWATKKSLMLGVAVSQAEREAFFECAWDLFLYGVRGRPTIEGGAA